MATLSLRHLWTIYKRTAITRGLSKRDLASTQLAFYGGARGVLKVLTYFEAAQRIAGVAPPVRHSTSYCMRDVVSSYLEYVGQHRKSIADARSRLTAYVIPYLAIARSPA